MPKTINAWITVIKCAASWLVVWSDKDTGLVYAVCPESFADRADAAQHGINTAHLGFRDPRTVRKFKKWIDVESLRVVVRPKLEALKEPWMYEALGRCVANGTAEGVSAYQYSIHQDFPAKTLCDKCGCRLEQHATVHNPSAVDGACPKTDDWGVPTRFPSHALADADFRAKCDIYWQSAGTTFAPRE